MIHRQLGTLFSMFCAVMLGWHILTPGNPHHIYGLVLHSSLALFFLTCSLMPLSFSKYGQPFVLIVSAMVVAWSGNVPTSAVIVFIAFLLYFAYGGFRTISTEKVISSFASIFILNFISIHMSGFYKEYADSYLMALIWTTFSIGLFWVLWIIFQAFAADIVQQNRDLLEQNKTLKRCKDVAAKGK